MMIRNFFGITLLLLCTATLLDAHAAMAVTNNSLSSETLALADPTKPDFSEPVSVKKTKVIKKNRKSPKNPVLGLSLQQTLISKTRKIAIISGKTLNIGDEIRNAKLVKINSDNVVLLYRGKKHTLNLTFPSEIKEVKR